MSSLYLLDAMALIYRAHFAFMRAPIFTTSGVNTSALFGFTNTLLDLLSQPDATHLAVAFDTQAPTARHVAYSEYKAQRESIPEDLIVAIPAVKRLLDAMNIPRIELDGYEADDIIGTLAARLTKEDPSWQVFMVTPDKDFGQLVTDQCRILKPGRAGQPPEILGVKEVCERWGIKRTSQVIDMLALTGDVSDNIPGVPGIGEKTAAKLIAEYDTFENVLLHAESIKGKIGGNLKQYYDQALLSRRLVEIDCQVPVEFTAEGLRIRERNDDAVKALLAEYEFNAIGRRLYGNDFKAGRSALASSQTASAKTKQLPADDLFASQEENIEEEIVQEPAIVAKKISDVPHEYHIVRTPQEHAELIQKMSELSSFCFDLETTGLDPKEARCLGIAVSWEAHRAVFAELPREKDDYLKILALWQPLLEGEGREKIGHNLKFDLSILMAHGMEPKGPFFDTMIAHALLEPDQRHNMDYLSETYLGYRPISFHELTKTEEVSEQTMLDFQVDRQQDLAEYAAEDADVTWQLAGILRPMLEEKMQHRVFHEVECPLLPVLAQMELTGIAIDANTLHQQSKTLLEKARQHEAKVYELCRQKFNLNSPKQLGDVLFGILKIADKPKKTRTGHYATDESTLSTYQGKHPVIDEILAYRGLSKLVSTYTDALPRAVSPYSGRVHTTFHQMLTYTGRLASSDPNLQNIPIRTEDGRAIREAFVPGEPGWVLLSSDYSQIELRIMASLSGDPAMREAFRLDQDIHAATAAKIFHVPMEEVTSDMRRASKSVNFGIIYGMSAFGLSQNLSIAKREAQQLIDAYFAQYSGVKKFMDESIERAREKGYTETMTGRRRYLRDIASNNRVIRSAAERVAINTPIQGTAADMIKLAMVRVQNRLQKERRSCRMLLQVHDELVFECPESEAPAMVSLIQHEMENALPLEVPVRVETGIGKNWRQAH